MLTKVTGKLVQLREAELVLALGPIEIEVLIPEFARRQLQSRLGDSIQLHTIDYLEGNPMQGRLVPRVIGFLNEAERDFFNLFCSVDGVGVKKALRAMIRPVQEVAGAIEQQDAKALATLPGIGPATADRVVAKLRRKMPKFALLVTGELPDSEVSTDLVHDAFEVLCALGHTESHARQLIDEALAKQKKFKDVDDLIRTVYEQVSK